MRTTNVERLCRKLEADPTIVNGRSIGSELRSAIEADRDGRVSVRFCPFCGERLAPEVDE